MQIQAAEIKIYTSDNSLSIVDNRNLSMNKSGKIFINFYTCID